MVRRPPQDLATVLRNLGRAVGEGGGPDRVRLQVGDDGCVVVPWDGE